MFRLLRYICIITYLKLEPLLKHLVLLSGQPKSPPAAANNNPVEKANDSPKNKTKSPPSKNSADKRRR